MSGTMQGMNPEEVEALALRLRHAQSLLDDASTAAAHAASLSLSPWTYAIQPGGLLLAPTAIVGTQLAAVKVRDALGAIEAKIGRLLAEVDQQRQASGQYTATTFVLKDGKSLPIPPTGADPGAIRAWWSSLSRQDRERIIEQHPEFIRNLDGIPASVRVDANKSWAAQHWDDPSRSTQERDYLRDVADGKRCLYLYDESGERIIEVVGTIGRETTNVVTYVPGTDCDMVDFYKGSVQQFAQGLEDADVSGGTVVFVYKDGPWVTWPAAGAAPGNAIGMKHFGDERSNLNGEYLAQKGQELAQFQSILGLDSELAGTRHTVISHSAGNTIAAYSEMYGAHYDNYVSLAGSWLPPGWSASQGTEYDHFQYTLDAINGLDPFANTPHNSGAFESHGQGWGDGNPGDNHGRIAERSDNLTTILGVYQQITDGRP